jgi:putative ABC transport system permease protein
VLRLALGTLRSRRGGFLGALVGVILAVTLVVSSAIVVESTLRAGVPVDRLAAAPVVVARAQSLHLQGGENDAALRERARVDARLAVALRTVPGVERAVADRTLAVAVATVAGRRLTDVSGPAPAHGWSSAALEPLGLTAGRPPRAAGDVVLDAGLARAWSVRPGDRLRVSGAFAPRLFTVSGVAAPPPGHGPSRDPALYLRDDVAAGLSGTGTRVGLIGLVVSPGADVAAVAGRVRSLAAPLGLRVLTGAARGEVESLEGRLAREDLLSGLSVLGSLAAFVAIFVVASAFALSVQQRHRELALIRTIGGTPGQVRAMVAAEALVVAVAGAAVAAPLGLAVATAERGLFVHEGMLPSSFRLAASWIPFALGFAAAIAATQLAAFASGRRASRIRPVDALREAAVEHRPLSRLRGLAGVAALVVGVAVFVATTRDVSGGGGDDAPAAGIVWMLAATLLGPVLALPFVWLAGSVLERLSRGPGLLARASSRTNLRRLTSVATPLMLTVSLACALLVSRSVVREVTKEQASRSVVADHVLVPAGRGGLVPAVAAEARILPGVRRAVATLATQVLVAGGGGNPEQLPAQAVAGAGLGEVVDLGVTAGSIADLRGDGLAVAERRARSLGWSVGDRVRLWLGDGTPVRLRVAALFRRAGGFGEVVLPRRVVEGHVTSALDDAVFVSSTGAAAPAALARAHPEAELLTRSEFLRRVDAAVRRQAVAVYLLLGVVVLFSAIAAVNALSMAISERARELELLRLIGATRRQLRRMIRLEVVLTVAFATTLGMLTAAPGIAVFSYGKSGSFVPAAPAWIWLGLPASAFLLGLAASVLPTRSALRAGRGSVTAGVE